MMKTENDTVISVISNLRIDSTLVNEYLPFAHFFPFFFIHMLYLLHSLVKYIYMSIYSHVLVYQEHHIDLSALLNSCICDLKYMHFICQMILFLWSLCFRYLFHAFNVSCIFHMICSRLDFITTSKQLWFQKFLA